MTRRTFALLAALALLVADRPLTAQARGTLAIAAAADLQTALPEIAAGFEKATGINARLTFGSSGNFFAQIQNGAPFDLFFSADADYPQRLATAGQIDTATLYQYATGGLVIWTRADSGLDVRKGLPLLLDARVRRIAIANPAFAPYGRAAVATLRSADIHDRVEKKLVFAENVSQAAQLAQSGNADVALIGHALALGSTLRGSGQFFEVPDRLHPPLVQSAGIVSASKNRDNARAFLEYLKGTAGAATLRSYGFTVPTPPRGPRQP